MEQSGCDDDNYFDDDGCSSLCEYEDGFYLDGTYAYNEAQSFLETCDGYDYGYLDCDCGNVASGVGCDGCAYCSVMHGYTCSVADIPSDGSDCFEICGDSYNYAEDGACDDGNQRNGDGCSKACSIEFGWECNYNTYNTADVCYEICNDGYNFGQYICDDGNSYEYDGCDTDCNIVDGWYCWGGSKTGPDQCAEECGDGRNFYKSYGVDSCDDGNTDDGDGCDSDCQVEFGYECAGGTYDDQDICHEICGDGYRMSGEFDCDDGNSDDGDGCSSGCQIEVGFICTGGSTTHYDTCYEECGDGLRFTSASNTDFCDDGNNDDYDGCDADCAVEFGFECTGGDYETPDTCYETCGDGYNMGYLSCDDGNTDSFDGCSSGCDIEVGYDCAGGSDTDPDVCVEICGDSYNMGIDECDDGDLYDNDGCSSGCNVEDGWYCFGGDHDSPDSCYEICGDAYHYFYDFYEM